MIVAQLTNSPECRLLSNLNKASTITLSKSPQFRQLQIWIDGDPPKLCKTPQTGLAVAICSPLQPIQSATSRASQKMLIWVRSSREKPVRWQATGERYRARRG